MSNTILALALNDFDLDNDTYVSTNRNKLEKIMEEKIIKCSEKKTLELSQQIILNNKKKIVTFYNDSPSFDEVINNERKTLMKKKKRLMEYSPCMEYIDICIAAASKRKTNTKIECKKYLK